MKAVAVLAILIALASPTFAQDEKKDCRMIRAEGASFLEDCGKQLHSFTLGFDLRHVANRDQHGRFAFRCPIEPMCVDEPQISGFFIEPEGWQKGPKDEKAIFDAFRSKIVVSWRGSPDSSPPMPAATCPVFDVSIGDMAGRAVCYGGIREKWSTIVLVVADDRVGIVLNFFQADQEAEPLRNKVLALAPRFTAKRATGDSELLGWMR